MESILKLNYHQIINNLEIVEEQEVQNVVNVRFYIPENPFEGKYIVMLI